MCTLPWQCLFIYLRNVYLVFYFFPSSMDTRARLKGVAKDLGVRKSRTTSRIVHNPPNTPKKKNNHPKKFPTLKKKFCFFFKLKNKIHTIIYSSIFKVRYEILFFFRVEHTNTGHFFLPLSTTRTRERSTTLHERKKELILIRFFYLSQRREEKKITLPLNLSLSLPPTLTGPHSFFHPRYFFFLHPLYIPRSPRAYSLEYAHDRDGISVSIATRAYTYIQYIFIPYIPYKLFLNIFHTLRNVLSF